LNDSDAKPIEELTEEINDRTEEKNRLRDESPNEVLATYLPGYERRFKGFKLSTIKNIVCNDKDTPWSDNEWAERIPVRQEYHNEKFALQTFLVYEKAKFPYDLKPKQFKEFDQVLKARAHPELLDHYAFPYFFVKYNPEYATKEAPKGAQFRQVFAVRSIQGDLDITAPTIDGYNPDSVALVNWCAETYKLQISKKLFELRDKLIVSPDFIEKFLQFDTDGRDIFTELKSFFQKKTGYVDVDEHWATFLALWTMATHVFYLFNAFPYVLVYSVGGQGKTRLLKTMCYSSRNGWLVENPSAASIYRGLDVIHSALFVDEADKVKEEVALELLGIWNSGYEAGHAVPRWVMEENRLADFSTFSPKAFATNKKLDNTLASRCIRVPMLATDDEEVQFREPFMDEPLFVSMREDLTIWAIDSTPAIIGKDRKAIMRKYKARFEEELKNSGEISTNIPPRLVQIMTPILVLYDLLNLDNDIGISFPSERENLRKVMSAIINDKRTSMVPWLDQEVILGLYDVLDINQTTIIHSKDIADQINGKEDSGNNDDPITPSKIGLVLDKYFSEDKRQVHGRTEWLPYCKGNDERLAKVMKVMDRLNIEYQSKTERIKDQTQQAKPAKKKKETVL
jgi:hypothetical protein